MMYDDELGWENGMHRYGKNDKGELVRYDGLVPLDPEMSFGMIAMIDVESPPAFLEIIE